MDFSVLQTGEAFLEELHQEIRLRCRFHVQCVLDAVQLAQVAEGIFRILNHGIGVELILVSPDGKRDLMLTNTLLRMGSGGAELSWIQEAECPVWPFAIIDKAQVIVPQLQGMHKEQSKEQILAGFRSDFRTARSRATAFERGSSTIDLQFEAIPDMVPPGEAVQLRWVANGADRVRIDPEIGEVTESGQLVVYPEKDCCYTVSADNSVSEKARKVFIKVLPQSEVRFQVSVYETEIEGWIELHSPEGFQGHYAVEAGQKVKIRWDCPRDGQLHCDQLGALMPAAQHEMIIYQDTRLDFHFKQVFSRQSWTKTFVVVDADEPIADEEDNPRKNADLTESENKSTLLKEWRDFWRKMSGRKSHNPHE